ncbi:pentapeptide repeat-containing protein [Paenibacillus thalictri]|uniref:Pentapeptide repeat-containing protein n=1 Tax=Paenibacillus thalictri TaxID=2527873 RepID=A0A4Q9DSE7_9BACL|nr:pentapeptide repeat-containing protein [Paenibacillus thalictri]TBL77252.1 pentapeptide repeat-containing protein [Paenibacillus thalictri]
MSIKLKQYLDDVFAKYEDSRPILELKDELYQDLQEKLNDLKSEGYDEDAAFHRTVNSIGEISELIETIHAKTRELQQIVGMDFSKSNLQNSDLKSVKIHEGKFNYSNLQGSDFSHSDLTNSSFKCSNLDNSKFDGADLTGAEFNKSNLKGASFKNTILNHTVFKYSELAGVVFDHQSFEGTVFDYSGLKGTSFRGAVFKNVSFKTEVKKAIFDGAVMDKPTYAILKGYKANLTNVTVI